METNKKIEIKSKQFAIRIVNLYKFLIENKNEKILSKQVLRSGTSVGANVAEAQCSPTKKDFASKLNIALKECNETLYWLELLSETSYIDKNQFDSIYFDCEELKKMLVSIIKTCNINIQE